MNWNVNIALTVLVCSVLVMAMNVQIQNNKCPSECFCSQSQTYVSCINKSLENIPKLPMYVTNVVFEGNHLEYIAADTLKNLWNLHLEILSLANNSIHLIHPFSFVGLNQLRSLDLSNNPKITPDMLQPAIRFLGSSFLNTLLLDSLNWKDEPINLFKELSRFNLETLSLRGVDFHSLSFENIRRNFPNIVNINLNFGSLQTIQPSYLRRLEKLELQYNYIDIDTNFFVNRHGSCYFPNLRELRLDSNFIIEFESRFVCLDRLQVLTLDNNPVKTIRNNTFSELPSLEALSICYLGDRLYKLESLAFNSTSLRTLNLSGNGITFEDDAVNFQFDKFNIFRHAPNLMVLDLSGNVFNLSSNVFTKMVLPVTFLRKLVMTSCLLTTLPTGFLYNMEHLKIFIINNNRIDSWNGAEVFGNKTKLHTLNLQGNSITTISEDKFPLGALQDLTKLDLSYNPYECSCDNFWFRQWIMKNTTLFQNFPKGYHCRHANKRKRINLENYNPTLAECTKENQKVFLIVVASLSIFGIAFITIISILFKARWHIRYWIYLLYVKRKGYSSLNINEKYSYDGFVIYCDEDTKWVREKLLNELEKKRTFKLCIHHRDFEGGKLIVDNIAANMSLSRKIIIVISRDMTKSDWCLFETRVAQEKFLNKEMDALVILMLENIPNMDMPASLRILINSTTYIQCVNRDCDDDRFWDEVEKSLHWI